MSSTAKGERERNRIVQKKKPGGDISGEKKTSFPVAQEGKEKGKSVDDRKKKSRARSEDEKKFV